MSTQPSSEGHSNPKDDAPRNTMPVRSSLAYRLGYIPIRLLLSVLIQMLSPRLRVTGRYHVPRHGPVILAPNHLSNVDPAYVSHASPRSLWFMAKEELFEMGLIASVMRYWQTFPIDQGGADRAALRYAEQLLQSGQGLVIFPEGRCSPTGELEPILPGAILLALRTNVPVIPVGLYGTNHVIPFGKLAPRPTLSRVCVHFAAPIRFSDLKSLPRREQREAAIQRLEEAMQAARTIAQHAVSK
jgi:1-acyl-sn-glycerol-3-phosphate acyltransferase